MLVQIASQFKSEIVIECNDARANGKSILDIMMLGIGPDTEFTVLAYGDDADRAVEAVNDFFRSFSDEGIISEATWGESSKLQNPSSKETC